MNPFACVPMSFTWFRRPTFFLYFILSPPLLFISSWPLFLSFIISSHLTSSPVSVFTSPSYFLYRHILSYCLPHFHLVSSLFLFKLLYFKLFSLFFLFLYLPSHLTIPYHFFTLISSTFSSTSRLLSSPLPTSPPLLSCPSAELAVITVDSELSSFFIESVNDMWHRQWF